MSSQQRRLAGKQPPVAAPAPVASHQSVAVPSNLVTALKDLRHTEQAIATYREALAIEPDKILALPNLGVTLKEASAFATAVTGS